MALDLAEIALDADLGINVVIIRTTGVRGIGGWLPNHPTNIPAWGIKAVAETKALNMIPEGDRVRGAFQFITTTPIFVTQQATSAISDQIQWGGNMYSVQSVEPWEVSGYFSAILLRETGT